MPEDFYKPTLNTKSKTVEVWRSRRTPRPTIIGTPERFRMSTPTRNRRPSKFEIAAALRERLSSEHRNEVYPNVEYKAAEVWKRRSPPRTTSIAGPKSFTNLPPIRNRKPPKFVRPEALREPRSSKPRKVLRRLPQREIESRRSQFPQHALCTTHRFVTLKCTPTQALSQPISELRRSQDIRFEQRGTSSPSQINDS
ncbi:hypothetical protein NPIL_466121, partial [Nephila pilipes]